MLTCTAYLLNFWNLDLSNLAFLLHTLQTFGRFMVEKRLLNTILTDFLPQRQQDLQELTWAREERREPMSMVHPTTYEMQAVTPDHSILPSGCSIPYQARCSQLSPYEPLDLRRQTLQYAPSERYVTPQLRQYGREICKYQQRQLQNWADVIRPPNTPTPAGSFCDTPPSTDRSMSSSSLSGNFG